MMNAKIKFLSDKAKEYYSELPIKYQSKLSSGFDLLNCGYETNMLMMNTYVLYDIDDKERCKYDEVDELSFCMFEKPGKSSNIKRVEVINGVCKLGAGAIIQIKTGISIEVPNLYKHKITGDLKYFFSNEVEDGYNLFEINEVQIRSRSGLSAKKQLVVINQPGTIDNDYRGEIIITLKNLSNETIIFSEKERLAQAIICPVKQASFIIEDNLTSTERGSGGFGSTGI
jgi:dUTPase